MSVRAELRLLGPARLRTETLEAGPQEHPLPAEAPLWLVTLLACHGEPLPRSEVWSLLFAGVEEGAARNRLRNLLHRTRQLPLGLGLDVGARHLAWTGTCDVRDFRQAGRGGRWERALALYGGPLLAGAPPGPPAQSSALTSAPTPAVAPAFAAWLDAERDELRTLWLSALQRRADELERSDPAAALELLESLLQHDPHAEEAVGAALRCAAALHRPAEVERLYARFRAELRRELGVAPSGAVTALYRALSVGLPVAAPEAGGPGAPPGTASALTAFFGREEEQAAITAQLLAGERVVTLVGPGGAGKTRLAREAMARARAPMRVFVSLEGAASAEGMVDTLVAALALPASSVPPLEQLLGALAERRALLVLDNLEHLLVAPARAGVLELLVRLTDAPGVQLLITSRVRAGLAAEWVVALGGLPYPQVPHLEAVQHSGAVRLFVERARRVRPGFALTPQNVSDLIRVCQLTGGLPLALELTAAGLAALPLPDLVAELSVSLDLLDGDAPDRPERHRSLRAAFLHSWRLLDPAAGRALARLSVFRGSFERAAALAVTGPGGLRSLLRLSEHSLLRRGEGAEHAATGGSAAMSGAATGGDAAPGVDSGRLSLHEVVRQYAAEMLAGQAGERREARRAHAEHYARLALGAAPHLRGPEQARQLAALEREHANLRVALDWTEEQGDAGAALTLALALHWFWYVRGHHREGLARLLAALALPGGSPQARAAALGAAGGLARDLGDRAASERHLRAALRLARAQDLPLEEAGALHGLGLLARERGEFVEAADLFARARRLQQADTAPWALAATLNDLGIVLAMQEDRAGAGALFRESLALKEALGDLQGVAYALANLGNVSADSADFLALTRRSLEIKRALGDRQGTANSLYNLANEHLSAGDVAGAQAELREALALYWQLGLQRGVAASLAEFSRVAFALGRPAPCLVLAGAAQALTERAGLTDRGMAVGPVLEQARAASGAQAETLYRQGRGLNLERAVEYALALAGPEADGLGADGPANGS